MPVDVHPELLAHRREFPILETTTYLINNSLGAMPRAVTAALEEYAATWRRRGVRAWHEGWWDLPVATGDLLAPILGVGAGDTAMHANVTLATAVFLSCLDYPPARNRVVYTELNFPSLRYLLDGERRKGAEIVVVPSPDGVSVPLESLLAAIDERTRLVPISHVVFKSGAVQDAQTVARRCREVGALLLLDVFQSAGILPLELAGWGVHAAVGGCLKWLCGGPGNGYLWIAPELSPALEPALTGWQSHRAPFDFAPDHDRVRAGAWRFLNGTPVVPALCAARPGLELIGRLPVAAIRARSLFLTDRLIAAATAAGFAVRTPGDHARRGGTVTVAHEAAEPLCSELLARDILCDFRPGAGVRFSPHFYNTVEECDHAVATLARLRDQLPP